MYPCIDSPTNIQHMDFSISHHSWYHHVGYGFLHVGFKANDIHIRGLCDVCYRFFFTEKASHSERSWQAKPEFKTFCVWIPDIFKSERSPACPSLFTSRLLTYKKKLTYPFTVHNHECCYEVLCQCDLNVGEEEEEEESLWEEDHWFDPLSGKKTSTDQNMVQNCVIIANRWSWEVPCCENSKCKFMNVKLGTAGRISQDK